MRTVRASAVRWSVFTACVAGWHVVATTADSAFLPTPLTVLAAVRNLWILDAARGLFDDVLPGLARMLGAWAVASLVGVVAGVALGVASRAAAYGTPVLAFLRSLPPIMLVPLFLDLFRIGTPMQLATIGFGAVWPVLLSTMDGARSVHRTQLDTVRVFRVGGLRRIVSVVLPAALPTTFGGLRLSLQIAIVLMVFSEYVGGTDGIGYRLFAAAGVFDYPAVWAAVVLLGAVGYTVDRLLTAVERWLLGWHTGVVAEAGP